MPSACHTAALRNASAAGLGGNSSLLEAQRFNPAQEDLATAEASITSSSPSLLFRSSRLRSLRTLAQEQSALRFSIDALLDEALEPLQNTLRARKRHGAKLADGQVQSWARVECVALGYLGVLLRFPGSITKHEEQYLDAAVAEHIRRKWPDVVDWYNELDQKTFADWRSFNVKPSRSPTLTDRIRFCANYALDYVVPHHSRNLILRHTWPFSSVPALSIIFGVITSLGWVAFGLVSAKGQREQVFLRPLSSHSLRGMGEAGAMLGVLGR